MTFWLVMGFQPTMLNDWKRLEYIVPKLLLWRPKSPSKKFRLLCIFCFVLIWFKGISEDKATKLITKAQKKSGITGFFSARTFHKQRQEILRITTGSGCLYLISENRRGRAGWPNFTKRGLRGGEGGLLEGELHVKESWSWLTWLENCHFLINTAWKLS